MADEVTRGVGGTTRMGGTPNADKADRSNQRRTNRFIIILLLPAALWLGLFFYYPLARVVGFSLADGVETYVWALTDTTNVAILTRTGVMAASVTAICVGLGFPYAFLMASARSRQVLALLAAAVIIPLWTNSVIRSFAWVSLLQDSGLVNDVLEWAGFERQRFIGTTRGIVMAMAHVMMPFAILPLFANLRSIDMKLVAAASSLGAKPLVTFWRVYIPQARPGIGAAALIVFVLSLGFYITPIMIGSPRYAMISSAISAQIQGLLNWTRGSALAVVLLLLTLLVLAVGLLGRRIFTPRKVGRIHD